MAFFTGPTWLARNPQGHRGVLQALTHTGITPSLTGARKEG